jgi:hypothetical protein
VESYLEVTLTSIAVLNMLNVEWQKGIFITTFFIDFGITVQQVIFFEPYQCISNTTCVNSEWFCMASKGHDGPTITQVSKRQRT